MYIRKYVILYKLGEKERERDKELHVGVFVFQIKRERCSSCKNSFSTHTLPWFEEEQNGFHSFPP
jgi:hypothetical protein